MRIQDLDGKTVCLLGYGKEGQATLKAIEQYAPGARVTVADSSEELNADSSPLIAYQLGKNYLKDLHVFDVIIKSPGIPPQPEFSAVEKKITNATQIFLDTVKEKGSTVIGVTGTKGKSTTSSLIAAVLQSGKKKVFLVGNIGKPALDYLDKATPETFFVMELSSYQLMHCTSSPHIAVVTSFFPEHLDYHGSLQNYKDAKAHITRFQTADDAVFYNAEWQDAKDIADESAGEKIPFAVSDAPVLISDTKLKGDHNLSNIAAAFKVGQYVGISTDDCVAAIKTFEGLPHRLQSIGMHHDIEWVDDAISTTPESTIAALRALGENVRTIIVGGQDRGLNFETLADEIVHHSNVETVLVFPGTGPRIQEAIEKCQSLDSSQDDTTAREDIQFYDAPTMEDAVRLAKEHTPKGMTCLLSTASPSYNMFKNFEEKGDVFQRCIRES